jgi:diacylglycerol O-acyltransferase / wax synthase
MGVRRRLGVQDALWLEMDRPNNLMVVDSVIWTSEPLDWSRVRQVIDERMSRRYSVFRSRAVRDDDGHWWWEEDPHFDLDNHVDHVTLDDPHDPRSLQSLVGEHRTRMLDRERPLWTSLWVDRYRSGSAVITRTHHAIADGVRMVELAMSLFDADPSGGPVLGPSVTLHAAKPHPPGQAASVRMRAGVAGLRSQALKTVYAATEAGREAVTVVGSVPDAVRETGRLLRSAPTNPVGAGHGLVSEGSLLLGRAAHALRSSVLAALPGGGPLIDLASATPADLDTARKLLLGTRNDTTIWTGRASTEKGVAWAEPLPLAEVKSVARAHRATVNDVLVACVATSLREYLASHQAHCASVSFMVPVNLKPLDSSLPDELGNNFALVQLELPTDEPDPVKVLDTVKRRMTRIKHGHEAAVGFRVQETISSLSHAIYEAAVDVLANRSVGVLTNVPGPPMTVYLAGSRVEGIVGWAPLSGDQPMSLTVYSYDGKVIVGVACDRTLVPRYERIVDDFGAVFARLRDRTPL